MLPILFLATEIFFSVFLESLNWCIYTILDTGESVYVITRM